MRYGKVYGWYRKEAHYYQNDSPYYQHLTALVPLQLLSPSSGGAGVSPGIYPVINHWDIFTANLHKIMLGISSLATKCMTMHQLYYSYVKVPSNLHQFCPLLYIDMIISLFKNANFHNDVAS